MSKNGVEVVGKTQAEVSAKADEQIAAKLAKDANAVDDAHLVVILSEESYKAIREVVERATARGLDSSFEHWLNDAIKTGTTARLRTWNDRDYVTLFKQAAGGNAMAKAKLAKLLQIEVAGTNPTL